MLSNHVQELFLKLPTTPTPTYFLIYFKEIASTILVKSGGNCPHTPRDHAIEYGKNNVIKKFGARFQEELLVGNLR